MPGCHFIREERGGRVTYTLSGKLDGADAWELRSRIEAERSGALSIDFSRVSEFADYGVAVLSQSFADTRNLIVTGLRQHTLRVFRYFGLDCDALSVSLGLATAAPSSDPRRTPKAPGARELV
jgi:anti-anti-sigma regulatory factor